MGLLAGCGPLEDREQVGVAVEPLVGVPVDGYPNYQERLMLVAINRARSAPNVSGKTSSTCSTARTAQLPLMYNHDASRAARFHGANTFLSGGSLSHSSYCNLRSNVGTTYGSTCDGNKSCACVAGTDDFSCVISGGHGTDFAARAALFGFDPSSSSEVLAAGHDSGWDAVWEWMKECPNNDGHRLALTSATYNQIGVGYHGGTSCGYSRFYGGELGNDGPARYALPAGAHRPQTGTSFDFYVNYYNSAGAPQAVKLVVDGVCKAMTLELGAASNGTYKTSKTVTSACHEYWFLAYTASGARRVYPEKGAWGVGTCTAYKTNAMQASCEDCLPGETQACGVGQCAGTRSCALGKWTSCNGPAPSAEVCDGVDNNCDGKLPANESDADHDSYRVCEGDCNDGNANVHPGAAEGCNGVDNNCDGSPAPKESDADDDGHMVCEGDCNDTVATIHPDATEVCNGSDDDCDGETDEGCACTAGQSQPCGSDEGECVAGTQHCEAGAWSSCEGQTGPVDEICGDGFDNDCNGVADDDCGSGGVGGAGAGGVGGAGGGSTGGGTNAEAGPVSGGSGGDGEAGEGQTTTAPAAVGESSEGCGCRLVGTRPTGAADSSRRGLGPIAWLALASAVALRMGRRRRGRGFVAFG